MYQIDVMSRTPVYEQIIQQTEEFILKGILSSGDRMPSVRTLSVELSVNPNTIQRAISELDRMNLIKSVPGKGSFISDNALDILRLAKADELEGIKTQLLGLKTAGITKEDVMRCVNEVYKDDGINDNVTGKSVFGDDAPGNKV